MKDTASSAVKITYYSNCLNPNDPVKKTTKCEGLKVDSEVRFQVIMMVAIKWIFNFLKTFNMLNVTVSWSVQFCYGSCT